MNGESQENIELSSSVQVSLLGHRTPTALPSDIAVVSSHVLKQTQNGRECFFKTPRWFGLRLPGERKNIGEHE